jgi:hypothetical protein
MLAAGVALAPFSKGYFGDEFYGNNGVCLPLHIHDPYAMVSSLVNRTRQFEYGRTNANIIKIERRRRSPRENLVNSASESVFLIFICDVIFRAQTKRGGAF